MIPQRKSEEDDDMMKLLGPLGTFETEGIPEVSQRFLLPMIQEVGYLNWMVPKKENKKIDGQKGIPGRLEEKYFPGC